MHFTIREWAKTILWILAVVAVMVAIVIGVREARHPRGIPQVIEVDGFSQKIKLPNGQVLTIEDPAPPAAPDKPEGK